MDEVEHLIVWWCPLHSEAGYRFPHSEDCNTLDIGWIEIIKSMETDDGSNNE